MSSEQIRMTWTVGGTTKYGENSMIGNFGLGFKQLFNERLGTSKVRISTKSGDHTVEVIYHSHRSERNSRPSQINVQPEAPDFGTMVEVYFNNDHAARECLEEARKSLRYYPCRFTINGSESISEWDRARQSGARFFSADGIEGFIEPTFSRRRITDHCTLQVRAHLGALYHLFYGGHHQTL